MHNKGNKHDIDWEGIEILHKGRNLYRSRLTERMFIYQNTDIMNLRNEEGVMGTMYTMS